MGKTSSSSWARTIGGALANLQHGLDEVTEWGFKKMKQVGKRKKSDPSTESTPLRAAKGALGFLGEAGDAFYKEYESLKAVIFFPPPKK